MDQGEKQAGNHIRRAPAVLPEIPEHISPEKRLLHHGGQKDHDQDRAPGRGTQPRQDGLVVQIHRSRAQEPQHPAGHFVEPIKGNQTHPGGAQHLPGPVEKRPRVPPEEAPEGDQHKSKKDGVVRQIARSPVQGDPKDLLRPVEQPFRRQREDKHIYRQRHSPQQLLPGGHAGPSGSSLHHVSALLLPIKTVLPSPGVHAGTAASQDSNLKFFLVLFLSRKRITAASRPAPAPGRSGCP